MRHSEFQGIRERMGLGRREFGQLLGYTGNTSNIWSTIERYETGKRPVPPMVARLAYMIFMLHSGDVIALNDNDTPIWPDWVTSQQEDGK